MPIGHEILEKPKGFGCYINLGPYERGQQYDNEDAEFQDCLLVRPPVRGAFWRNRSDGVAHSLSLDQRIDPITDGQTLL